MSVVVIVCECGAWTQIWAAARHVGTYEVTPPDLTAAMQEWAAIGRCPSCRRSLNGSVLRVKNLPTELRPYDQMTDRSRRQLEWRAAGHDYPGGER